VSIDALPTLVLLEIFRFYIDPHQHRHSFDTVDDASLETWHTLVHVCRQWRQVVFASPRSLNLRLLCTDKKPVTKLLGIWPDLPIVVSFNPSLSVPVGGVHDTHNIVTALKCPDRVCEINLCDVPYSLSCKFASIEGPFPALTSLQLSSVPGNGYDDDVWWLPLPFL
jgi:hypothetical protein